VLGKLVRKIEGKVGGKVGRMSSTCNKRQNMANMMLMNTYRR
jgi:hypothetical protein